MLVLVLDNAGEIYNRYYNVKLVEVQRRNFRIVHNSDVVSIVTALRNEVERRKQRDK